MATYYVAVDGSDAAGDGSFGNPWATINHAVHQDVGAGDEIVVRPGTYVEQIWMWKGGSAAGQLTLRAEEPGSVSIRPPEGGYSTLSVRASYITVEGFDIVGGDGHGIDVEGAAHTRIIDNVVHDSGGSGIQFNYSEFILIEGNVVYGNAGTNGWHTSGISVYQNRNITGDTETPGFRTIIRNNISYDNVTGPSVAGDHTDGNGIIIDDFQSTQTAGFPNYTFPTLVENNLAYGNGGKGIQVTWSDFVTVRNNTVAYNNVDSLNSGTWRGELSNQQSSNNTWEGNIAVTDPSVNANNTAIGNYSYGGYVNENVVWTNNLTFNGAFGGHSLKLDGGNNAPLAADGNLLGVDPQFVNAALSNFALGDGSPASGLGRVFAEEPAPEGPAPEEPAPEEPAPEGRAPATYYVAVDGSDAGRAGVEVDASYAEFRQATSGDDIAFGGFRRGDFFGGDGNDTIIASLRGGNFAGGAGNDRLIGLLGSVDLAGNEGNDRLIGGPRGDRLSGGPGNDVLTGGMGRDTFVFREGDASDIITDFNPGRRTRNMFIAGDTIEIDVTGIDDFDQLMQKAQQIDGGVLFDFGNGDDLFLRGTLLAALDKDSFTFV